MYWIAESISYSSFSPHVNLVSHGLLVPVTTLTTVELCYIAQHCKAHLLIVRVTHGHPN